MSDHDGIQGTIPHPATLLRQTINFDESIRNRRESDIEKICDIIAKHEHDNYMSPEEFHEYEDLFSLKNGKLVREGTLSDHEVERLTILSLRLSQRINLYRPTHIVDEAGNEVLPTLPPMLMHLERIRGQGTDAVNILHSVGARDERTPMGLLQQRKAAENLNRRVLMSQNQESILSNIGAFDELAQQFHLKLHGKPVFQVEGEPTAAAVTQPAADIDFFDFDDTKE